MEGVLPWMGCSHGEAAPRASPANPFFQAPVRSSGLSTEAWRTYQRVTCELGTLTSIT